MASIICASSALSANHSSLVKRLRITNSKSSWVNPNSPIKSFYSSSCVLQHFSNKNKCFSVESSFFPGDGFSAFSLIPKFSRVATPKSSSFHTITAQDHGHGNVRNSIHQFSAKKFRGGDVSLADYQGKVLLIVNIPVQGSINKEKEYKFLNKLIAKFKPLHDQLNAGDGKRPPGFEILGFLYDAKETGGKRLWPDPKIISEAQFPLFDKVKLNNDYSSHRWPFSYLWEDNRDTDLWYFLKGKAPGGGEDVKDEFEKFLVDSWGYPIRRYSPFPSYENENVPQLFDGGRPSTRSTLPPSLNPIERDIMEVMRIHEENGHYQSY